MNLKKIDVVNEQKETVVSSCDVRPYGDRVMLFGHDLAFVEHQTLVNLVGYSEDGIMLMEAKVTLSTPLQMNLDIVRSSEKQERRNSLKVRVSMKAKIYKVKSNGRKSKYIRRTDELMTKDLSVGGIGFFSNTPYFKNQTVTVMLNDIKQGLSVNAVILRKQRLNASGYKYGYGCRFINLGSSEERVICEYVFKMQLINREKEREMELARREMREMQEKGE